MPVEIARDAVQEAAARVIERSVPFVNAVDLAPWVFTVASRLAIDDTRRAKRVDDGEVPESVEPGSVEQAVLARLELGAMRRAWDSLTAKQRAVLVAASDGQPSPKDRREQVRLAVQRHRARTALIDLIGGVGVAVAAIVRVARRTVPGTAAAAAALAVAVLVLPGAAEAPGGRTSGQAEVRVRGMAALPSSPQAVGPAPTGPSDAPHAGGVSPYRPIVPNAPATKITIDSPQDHSTLFGLEIADSSAEDRLFCIDNNPVVAHWCTPT